MPQYLEFPAAVQSSTRRLGTLAGTPQGMVFAAPPGAGNSWFVNEMTGSDNNSGTIQAPFASLTKAQSVAIANNGDVVYLYGTNHQSAPLLWAKNGVSLVGLTSPSNNDRARISCASTLTQSQITAMTSLVTVTAQGCSFINIGTFYGFNGILTPPASAVCWAEDGGRNYYQNVQFLGGGDVLTAAEAGMRSLTMGGNTGENLFVGCTVGLDTVPRITNANASLEFVSGAMSPRNIFRQCVLQALSQLAGNVHVLVSANGIDRYALFDRCALINAISSTATEMSAAFTVTGTSGLVLLQDCVSIGATVYATGGPIYIQGSVPTGATSGLAVAAT